MVNVLGVFWNYIYASTNGYVLAWKRKILIEIIYIPHSASSSFWIFWNSTSPRGFCRLLIDRTSIPPRIQKNGTVYPESAKLCWGPSVLSAWSFRKSILCLCEPLICLPGDLYLRQTRIQRRWFQYRYRQRCLVQTTLCILLENHFDLVDIWIKNKHILGKHEKHPQNILTKQIGFKSLYSTYSPRFNSSVPRSSAFYFLT